MTPLRAPLDELAAGAAVHRLLVDWLTPTWSLWCLCLCLSGCFWHYCDWFRLFWLCCLRRSWLFCPRWRHWFLLGSPGARLPTSCLPCPPLFAHGLLLLRNLPGCVGPELFSSLRLRRLPLLRQFELMLESASVVVASAARPRYPHCLRLATGAPSFFRLVFMMVSDGRLMEAGYLCQCPCQCLCFPYFQTAFAPTPDDARRLRGCAVPP